MTATVVPATRAQSAVQRAYVYVVALVAVHMIVLGAANILRVFAEIGFGAPSGGFTGLPFVFAEFNRPRDLYREQASLAIALLAVGTPAWWIHFRLSLADRRVTLIAGRAAEVRHLALYALVVIGFVFAAFSTTQTISEIWRRVVDALVTLPGVTDRPTAPPGVTLPPQPSRDDELRFQLLGAIPAIVAGLSLWLGAWIPLQRGLASPSDGEVERRSIVRKLAIYLIVFITAVAVLFAATTGLSAIIARLLGDPVIQQFTSLWHDLGFSVAGLVVFGPLWLFHRRVVEEIGRA